MKRHVIQQLLAWKNGAKRKPLILTGARQVGKTYVLKAFGEQYFRQTVYINFQDSTQLQELFERDFDIKRILLALEIESGLTIEAHDTLIILDEIQDAPKGLTALKYFCEKAPQYHIASAGSLLSVAMQHTTSFPVGKVHFIDLFPLSFLEFLEAMQQAKLAEALAAKNYSITNAFHEQLCALLRQYYFVGGMPEAVQAYSDYASFNEIKTIQENILRAYELDFSKYAEAKEVPRIRQIWQSVVAQLAKENKKFMWGQLRHGARAKAFEIAVQWLADAGLVHKVCNVTKPQVPLQSYANEQFFKLYLLDVGLLGRMAGLEADVLLQKNKIVQEFKGALTEQFVLQELRASGNSKMYYWTKENGTAEIDFLVQTNNEIIPIECKAEINLKAKSLTEYIALFNPMRAIRAAMTPHKVASSTITNLPLYGVYSIE